jgi:threonine aldolase
LRKHLNGNLNKDLYLTAKEVESELVLEDDVHYAPTKVISLENTLSGIIFPQEEILEISKLAQRFGLKMHLDGARIWHVATETGLPLSELCAPFDSVSLCFSKGLGKHSCSQ